MAWTNVDNLSKNVPLPEGYRYERLTRADIANVVRSLAEWYPGIAVGNASCHLDESFYTDKVVLDGELERDFFVILFKKEAELVGVLSVERDRDSEVLYGRVGAVSAKHRGLNLSERFPALIETMGHAMGMGMVYGLATLKVPHMQTKFERLGWQLIGIIPGFDREMVEPGVVKRVYEAIYTKVLVRDEDLMRPRYADMTSKTTELFELLYPGKASPA
ncbi:MAG TPA: hypothetical protein VJT81_05255 [Burkholderiales bacterium]|nr:hypothetical protein [Burkholderiales bacterium]